MFSPSPLAPRPSTLDPSRNNLGLCPLVVRGRPLRSRSLQKGFTLLESLVALAILAIALSAVVRATGAATNHVDAMRQRVLADWVAQNRLALHSGLGDWLPPGSQQGIAVQAGLKFIWQEKISATPDTRLYNPVHHNRGRPVSSPP